MNDPASPLLQLSLEHIKKMLLAPEQPSFPQEGADLSELCFIHEYLVGLRDLLRNFSTGNLSGNITLRGSLAGSLKALQANLLHLTWQIQQVAAGDFRHRIEFMGDFATAFNSMVEQLDSALTTLRQKEEELLRLTEELQKEIELKNQAMAALRLSEASFKYKAEHDPLTGVLNRRSFYEQALAGMSRAKLTGQYCGLAIFDIDRFKPFNDMYGHLYGDLALKHVTTLARSALRTDDIIGRFGGDEFVLFLAFAEKEIGRRIIERLRRTVANSAFMTDTDEVAVTISIGLVNIHPDLKESRDTGFLEKVIRHADTALYKAKGKGRNRVSSQTLSVTGKSAPEMRGQL